MESNFYGVVYKTVNIINNKIYIGQTTCIDKILQNKYKGSGVLFTKALKKYGIDNFAIEILYYAQTQTELDKLEAECILQYQSLHPDGYNLMTGGGSFGKHSDETKQKLSNLLSGENHRLYGKNQSNEAKKKISIANSQKKRTAKEKEHLSKINKGRKVSDEVRKKISEAMKGRKISETHRQNMIKNHSKLKGENHPLFGTKQSVEHIKKSAIARKGLLRSDDTKKKMSEARKGEKHCCYGKKMSDATKLKISQANKGKKRTEEVKQKLSKIFKEYHSKKQLINK